MSPVPVVFKVTFQLDPSLVLQSMPLTFIHTCSMKEPLQLEKGESGAFVFGSNS